jgi:hypothetical protein
MVMTEECPIAPQHGGNFVRLHPISVRIRTSKPADFLLSTLHEWLCNQRVRQAFRKAKLSGFEFEPAEVYYPRREAPAIEEYAELCVTGWGGIASPKSGIALIDYCPGCNRQKYRLPYLERVIDEASWDGSDFFKVWPLTQYVFCSEAAHSVITVNGFTGVNLVPADELVRGTGTCSPGIDIELSEDKRRAIAERFGF